MMLLRRKRRQESLCCGSLSVFVWTSLPLVPAPSADECCSRCNQSALGVHADISCGQLLPHQYMHREHADMPLRIFTLKQTHIAVNTRTCHICTCVRSHRHLVIMLMNGTRDWTSVGAWSCSDWWVNPTHVCTYTLAVAVRAVGKQHLTQDLPPSGASAHWNASQSVFKVVENTVQVSLPGSWKHCCRCNVVLHLTFMKFCWVCACVQAYAHSVLMSISCICTYIYGQQRGWGSGEARPAEAHLVCEKQPEQRGRSPPADGETVPLHWSQVWA